VFAYRAAGRLVAGLAIVTLVAGCGAAASPSPSATPLPPATPAATATPTPTPTPTPAPTPTPWSSGKAAAVTGTIDCGVVATAGTEQTATAPYTLSNQTNTCEAVASDPRVSGPGSLVLNIEGWDPALWTMGTNGVAWMYEEIKGPDGTWAGRTYGLYDKDGILHNYGILVGSEAYAGLIYVVHGTVPANSAIADTVGVIQPGTPPPGFPVTPFPAP
jgi:hypothetical protein